MAGAVGSMAYGYFMDGLKSFVGKDDRRNRPVLLDGVCIVKLSGYVDSYMHRKLLDQYRSCKPDDELRIELETHGGDLTAAFMIARVLKAHPGEVVVEVRRHAMSSGTIIALAASKIVMAPSAALGGVDSYIYGCNVPVARQVLDRVTTEWSEGLTPAESHTYLTLFARYSQAMIGKLADDHGRMIKDMLRARYPDLRVLHARQPPQHPDLRGQHPGGARAADHDRPHDPGGPGPGARRRRVVHVRHGPGAGDAGALMPVSG